MERIWKRDQDPQAWNDFYVQCIQVANIIKEAQHNHYKQIIKEHKHDYKIIFNTAQMEYFLGNKNLFYH